MAWKILSRRGRRAAKAGARRAGARGARGARSGRQRLLRGAALAAGVVLGALVALQLWYLGQVLWWTQFDPKTTSFMSERLERMRAKQPQARLDQRWVPYERISPHLARAVIAAEDARFTSHEGVDWDAIEKAIDDNLRKGKVVRGGSTITMQLAKNLFLSGERSYLRKAQEVVITYMIEAVMSKRRILEIYLNVAEWGEGVFGAEAAARHYWGVAASQLGPTQAATMAAMLPRPRFYDRNRDSPMLARRVEFVQRWMAGVALP